MGSSPNELRCLDPQELCRCFEYMLDCFGLFTPVRDGAGQIVDFHIRYLNPASCDNHLKAADEQIGGKLSQILPAHRGSGLLDHYARVVESGKTWRAEGFRYDDVCAGRKETRWFDIRVWPVGEGIASVWRDVSDREGLSQPGDPLGHDLRPTIQMPHRSAVMEAVLDQLTEGLVVFDPKGNLLSMNRAALAIHGFERVDAIPSQLEELTGVFELFDLDGNVLPTEAWPIGRALQSETFDGYEVTVSRRDNGKTWIGSYSGAPVFDQDGRMVLAIVTLRDVTKEKEALANLADSESRFRIAASAAPVILAQTDRDLRYRWVHNPHPDFDPAHVLGKRDDELENSQGVRQLIRLKQRVLETATAEREEIAFNRSNGVRIYDCIVEPLRNARGGLNGVTTAAVDITERKAQERLVEQSRDELEHRVTERTAELRAMTLALIEAEDRERQRLANLLHDDLQQLLVGANLHAALADRRIGQNPSLREPFDNLRELIEEAQRTSRNLSHDLYPAVLQEADAGQMLQWLADNAQRTLGLQVTFDGDGELGPADGNVVRFLYRTVREILCNTAKHAGVTEANLIAHRRDERIEVEISDRGAGFDPAKISATPTPDGLGLRAIEERAQAIGARMHVDSAPGEGTRFSLSIPATN